MSCFEIDLLISFILFLFNVNLFQDKTFMLKPTNIYFYRLYFVKIVSSVGVLRRIDVKAEIKNRTVYVVSLK